MGSVLAQRENEDWRVVEEGRFRPAGGDFQGIGVYRSDPGSYGWRLLGATPFVHRLDEPIRLSLG